MVCAASPGNGKDACQGVIFKDPKHLILKNKTLKGDSGGPLVVPKGPTDNSAVIFGIVSWGTGCGIYPGVYTRVPKYIPWIKSKRNH